MATYEYEALDSAGSPANGTVEADSSDAAIQQIRAQGYFPTSVRESDGGGRKRGKGAKASSAKKAEKAKKPKKAKKAKGEKKSMEIKLPAIAK